MKVVGTSRVREVDALVSSCPGPGKEHICEGERGPCTWSTAEQGFPTRAHHSSVMELQRKTGKAEAFPGSTDTSGLPGENSSNAEHIVQG